MSVTRTEIADSIEAAFAISSPSKADLLAAAVAAHARPPVLDLLAGLPDTSYRSVRDLWVHLIEVPVER